jgi:DNA-binding MarR family transcriptional regulator
MEKTIELVNLWGDFARQHPAASIEDFCRHYLASRQRTEEKGVLVGGVIPVISDGLLLKIIGRLGRLNMNYANVALQGTGVNQIEEFGMMLTIKQLKNPRKTEVIHDNLFEPSSGTDMLTRLRKRGLVKEYDDTEDRRSKRLEITAKGEKVIEAAQKMLYKNAIMIMRGLSEDDKQLCIQLLKNVEIKLSATWPKHRGKKFDEIYKDMMA